MQKKKWWRNFLRKRIRMADRKALTNSQFSIISSNCWGGVVYHDLGHEFLSPTINLWFEPSDFLKFVESLKWYLSIEPIEDTSVKLDYPVGKIGDIHLYFMHYNSFEEAKRKWIERATRINWDNIYVVMTEWPDSSFNLYEKFEKLPYKNKVLFTIKPHPEFPSTFCLSDAGKRFGDLSKIFEFKSLFGGYRYYDEFDFVSFLNKQ